MKHELDQTDQKILNLLLEDARQELSIIGRKVFKSPSSVGERIRKLQERGVILGYVAVLDPEKTGKPCRAITQVSLSLHTQKALSDFARQAATLAEVQSCYQLSGQADFVLHIAVSDTQAYSDFLMEKLCSLPNVAKVDTSFVLRDCKAGHRSLISANLL